MSEEPKKFTREQLATKEDKSVKGWLSGDLLKSQIAQALPRHCKPERFMRVLITAMQKTPKLMDCTRESLFGCFITCSQLGIEPDSRRAYLIPYGEVATLILDYKGLVELALRSGMISNIHADVVCENDDFEFNMGEIVRHKIDFKKPRGEMYCAYAMATFKDGTKQSIVMHKDEIEKVARASKSYITDADVAKAKKDIEKETAEWKRKKLQKIIDKDCIWNQWYDEMAKKTAFKRLSKWLPLSSEAQEIIRKEDEAEYAKEVAKVEVVSAESLFGGKSKKEEATNVREEEVIDLDSKEGEI